MPLICRVRAKKRDGLAAEEVESLDATRDLRYTGGSYHTRDPEAVEGQAKGVPVWVPLNASKWLPGPGDVRTNLKIPIPYNPLILKGKSKPPTSKRKPINVFLKAMRYQSLLQRKVVKNKNELAQREGVSRARITQILNLLKLAPKIQEYLLSFTDENQMYFFTEKKLRPIIQIEDHEAQLKEFRELRKKQEAVPSKS